MPVIEGAIGAPLQFAGVPVAGTSEVQTLTIGGTPDGGTFRLAYEGFTTAAISWTATDATLVAAIDAALEALPTIGTAGVTVADTTITSGIGDVTITFGGNLAKKSVPTITVASNALTGTDPTVEIAVTTPGVDPTFPGLAKGGLITDITNGKLYINTGTALSQTMTVVGAQS